MEVIDYRSFFDYIDDLPDFGCEDSVSGSDGNGGAEFDAVICPDMDDKCIDDLSSSEGFGLSDSVFPANNSDTLDFPAQPSDPYEDIVPLEWLANFIEDSYSCGGMTIQEENSSSTEDFSQNPFQFQTTSPDSVLESSSSCSNAKTISLSREKRARSKRSRPATFNPRPFQIRSPPSSCIDTPWPFFNSVASSVSEGFASTGKISRNKTANPKTPSQSAKKCMHCQITKTVQWREGPLGPGTLCNACGIRYKKSGELFPEYRPAASPTYVPSQHSNVRRKVLEMRSKIRPRIL